MKKLLLALAVFLPFVPSLAQNFIPNYDEGKVPHYVLPDPLRFANGQIVQSAADWENRKPEILQLFQEEMFGISPVWDGQMRVMELFHNEEALGGKAVEREVKLTLERKGRSVELVLLTYLPKGTAKAPMFVGLNFYGNHTISTDEGIQVTKSWIRNNSDLGYTNNKASDANRGSRITNWPVEDMVDRGYGLATMYYGDIDPDFDDGFANGVHALFPDEVRNEKSWGSVAAWAWGISRIVDYLEGVAGVDQGRLAVVGHSRLGKAALWAAAVDPRFTMAISNNSGCGGAALSRRRFGETVERINTSFPHWFNQRFRIYNNEEDSLPMDQHQLIAILAPHPVYIASAEDDLWADPKGEFLSTVAANPVYQLLGREGIPTSEWPKVEVPVMGTLGYHVRKGGHGMLYYDWVQYLDFVDKHWK